jgi:hypothetical protein
MKVLNRITLWVFIVVFLSSCTTFQLRDANNLLVDLYSAKMELEQKKYAPDEKLMLLANINEGLIQLAEDAAKEAQKRETKKLNKIAFYRIAATAAWQAMNTASDDDKKKEARKRILEYAAEGKSKCGNANDAPRDCGMLLIIPTLAGIDEHGSIHKKVSDEIDEKKANPSF